MIRFCKRCGVETARGPRGGCNPCAKVSRTTWAKANPERQKASAAAWAKANPERVKAKAAARQAAWAKANPEKAKARTATWRAANPEKVRAGSAAWKAANPENLKEKSAAYRAANLEKVKAASAAWRVANPDAHRIQEHNRNARKRANGGKLSQGLAAKLFEMQQGKCACCGQPLGTDYHLDHILPIRHGGPNTDSNIQLLTPRCNQQKGSKHPADFMRERLI